MYRTKEQLRTETKLTSEGKENMLMTHLADFDAADPRIRLYSLVQLKPGQEVQYHMHVGESELYFILTGRGLYNDNGNKIEVSTGMTTLTQSGEGHSLKNTGDEVLSFIALIIGE